MAQPPTGAYMKCACVQVNRATLPKCVEIIGNTRVQRRMPPKERKWKKNPRGRRKMKGNSKKTIRRRKKRDIIENNRKLPEISRHTRAWANISQCKVDGATTNRCIHEMCLRPSKSRNSPKMCRNYWQYTSTKENATKRKEMEEKSKRKKKNEGKFKKNDKERKKRDIIENNRKLPEISRHTRAWANISQCKVDGATTNRCIHEMCLRPSKSRNSPKMCRNYYWQYMSTKENATKRKEMDEKHKRMEKRGEILMGR